MTSMPKGTIQNSRTEDSVSLTTSTHQSHDRSMSIPTHLAGILEAGTAVTEHVPAGSTSIPLTLKRTSVPDGYERTIVFDQFEFETKLPA